MTQFMLEQQSNEIITLMSR